MYTYLQNRMMQAPCLKRQIRNHKTITFNMFNKNDNKRNTIEKQLKFKENTQEI